MTDRRAVVAVGLATLAFAAAMAVRERVDPWIATSCAAAIGVCTSVWALGRARLRTLLTADLRGVAGAVLLGVALVLATHAAFRAVATIFGPHVAGLYASIDVATPPLARAALTLCVVLAEELVWRGCATAIAGSLLAVGLYALPQLASGEWILVAAALGLGAVLDQQRRRSGGLVEPLLTHAIWSVSIFVVFPLV